MTGKSDASSSRDEFNPDVGKQPIGRPKLTGANKAKPLLSHHDGSCERVGKRDRRVAEVANTVIGHGRVGVWKYLLISESDRDTAKSPWSALTKFAS